MSDPFEYRHPISGEPMDRMGVPLSSRQKQIIWDAHNERELARLNRENGVIESPFDLAGLTVVALERYKPGVVRYTAMKGATERRMGFAKDAVFAGCQLS
jgi:hypothetical protein